MSETAVQPRGENFNDEEIERGLTALALCSGNSRRARKMLEHDPVFQRPPSRAILQVWQREHAGRYTELLNERAPEIEAAAIHDYRAIVAATNRTHLKLVQRTADGIKDLDAKDASAAAKNIAIAGGVAADKLLVFTDRPNVIHAHPDPMNTLQGLMTSLGIPGSIPSTAIEVPNQATSENPEIALLAESGRVNAHETAGESPSS